jgi:zinc protease
VPLERLEEAIDGELTRVRDKKVTSEEILRAKNQFETSFVARLESTAARAATLNQYEATRGDPGYAEKDLQRYRTATAEALQHYAQTTLDPGARVIIRVVPADAPKQGGAK